MTTIASYFQTTIASYLQGRRARVLCLGLVGFGALSTCCLVQSLCRASLDAASWSVGVALGEALNVAPREVVVDWEAVERQVASGDATDARAEVPLPSAKATSASPTKGNTSKSQKKGTKGVFVSAEQVLRLSKVARVPAARFVEKKGERPAGLQVAGVGGLGIGVQDGDVLTHVGGAEVKSSAAVISTVLQLRAKRAAAISGEFWRGQERFQIVFQMPYLSAAPAVSGSEARSPAPGAAQSDPPGSTLASN